MTFLCLLLAVGDVSADSGWPRLKLGMNVADVAATLGRPLICTKGHGFERWIYDNGAEVLIYGRLIGWTAPGVAAVTERSTDIWQARNAGTILPTIAPQSPPDASELPKRIDRGVDRPSGYGAEKFPLLRPKLIVESGGR